MAKSLGEALRLLNKLGGFNITGMNVNETDVVTSHINHKYRDELILPYVAIDNNIPFLIGNGKKQVITADGFLCDVVEYKEVHICELEKRVMELYKMDCWSFIKRWYATRKAMDSLHFVCMRLKKVQ